VATTYKDWDSIVKTKDGKGEEILRKLSSGIPGGYDSDVITTCYWAAGADTVVWPMT
jgi:hypothetical protein